LIGEGPVVFSCLLTTVPSVVTEEGIGELDGAKPQPKRGVRVSPIKLPGVTQFFQVHWKRLSPIIETHHIGGVILRVFPPMVGLHGDKLHRGQKHEAPGFPGAVMRDFHRSFLGIPPPGPIPRRGYRTPKGNGIQMITDTPFLKTGRGRTYLRARRALPSDSNRPGGSIHVPNNLQKGYLLIRSRGVRS